MDGYTKCFIKLTGKPFLAKPFTPDELKPIAKETLGRMVKNDSKEEQ